MSILNDSPFLMYSDGNGNIFEDTSLFVVGRSGWDAYRRLVKHYEPKQVTRSVVWRAQLLKADLCSEGDSKFLVNFYAWEANVLEYERQNGDRLSDRDRCGVVLISCPEDLKTHLSSRVDTHESFKLMREIIESFYVQRMKWDGGGGIGAPTPMDVNAILPAGGKGGGKGDKKKIEDLKKKKDKERREKQQANKKSKKGGGKGAADAKGTAGATPLSFQLSPERANCNEAPLD